MATIKKLVEQASDVDITKNTAGDKRHILQNTVRDSFNIGGEKVYAYLEDYDDDSIYFEIYDNVSGNYRYWKTGYTFNGTVAVIEDGDAVEVVRLTEWSEVAQGDDEDLSKSWVMKVINKVLSAPKEFPLVKQFDEEEMVAIEPLYVPAGVIDAHGDVVASDDVTQGMVDSLNNAIENNALQSGLFHKHLTTGYKIEKAWVNQVDCQIGETLVKAGLPIAKVKFTSAALWQQRKEGGLTGLSIGARASVEVVEE